MLAAAGSVRADAKRRAGPCGRRGGARANRARADGRQTRAPLSWWPSAAEDAIVARLASWGAATGAEGTTEETLGSFESLRELPRTLGGRDEA